MITFNIDPNTFDGDNNPPETQVEDIVVVNPEGNWHLYNHGHLELTRDCDKEYLELWDGLHNFPKSGMSQYLIIGGGDYQLVQSGLIKGFDTVDLVDPNIKDYDEWHKFYLGEYYKGYKEAVTEIPKTFGEFLKDYDNKHYDLVLTDISEPMMGVTDEIYSEEYFVNLLKLNCNTFMMYMPPTVYDELVPKLRKHFDMISSKGKFVKDWNEYCDVILFKRKER